MKILPIKWIIIVTFPIGIYLCVTTVDMISCFFNIDNLQERKMSLLNLFL
jgi:hypothetical protein